MPSVFVVSRSLFALMTALSLSPLDCGYSGLLFRSKSQDLTYVVCRSLSIASGVWRELKSDVSSC